MKLILGDCLPHLRSMPSKSVDLLCTDPPYGIGISAYGKLGNGRSFRRKTWDRCAPSTDYFDEMLRVARKHVIWGGNFFTDQLPPSRGWLVWWKNDGLLRGTYADCELAWTSENAVARVFNSRWSGWNKDSNETLYAHPTQKSLAVMKWCISSFSQPGDTVLDPFLGSGTTAVAAKLLKRHFIGVERDPEYMQVARTRVMRATFGLI